LHAVGVGPVDRAAVGIVVGAARQVLGQLPRRRGIGLDPWPEYRTHEQRDGAKHVSVHGNASVRDVDKDFDTTLRPGFGFVNKNLPGKM
jgi:hypothetical protein